METDVPTLTLHALNKKMVPMGRLHTKDMGIMGFMGLMGNMGLMGKSPNNPNSPISPTSQTSPTSQIQKSPHARNTEINLVVCSLIRIFADVNI